MQHAYVFCSTSVIILCFCAILSCSFSSSCLSTLRWCVSRCGSDLSRWTGVLSRGGSRAGAHSRPPHCWPKQPVSTLRWTEREDWSETAAGTTGRRRAFRDTSSKSESIHLKGCSSVKVFLSAVATVCCLKGFRRDQGAADVDWEKEGGGGETKQRGEDKQNK